MVSVDREKSEMTREAIERTNDDGISGEKSQTKAQCFLLKFQIRDKNPIDTV